MKNIVIVYTWNESPNAFGGIKTILESYRQHQEMFHAQGYNLFFFNYKPELVGRYGKLGHIIYGIKQKMRLKRYLKEADARVVHIHTSRDYLFMKDVLLARMIRKRFSLPVVITVHVGAAETVFSKTKRFKKWLTKLSNQYVNKLLFLSESIRMDFTSMGFENEKTGVLYNFHDLNPAPFVAEDDKSRHVLRLLYVGAMHREKGILDLLYAMKSLLEVDVHLDICGMVKDTGIKEEFEQLITELSDKVTMHGVVKGAEKTLLYEKSDVLVLPSYHEGMPMVILEALKTQCAIISTRVGAIPEILDDSNVYWVDVKCPNQISKAICYFYFDRSALYEMQNKNKHLSEMYSLENNVKVLCGIYNNL